MPVAAQSLRARLVLSTICICAMGSAGARADLTISKKPTQNVTCSNGVCSTTAVKAVLNVADLRQMLATSDVRVASASGAQDIVVKAALGWTSAHRLTLDGYRSVVIEEPLNVMSAGELMLMTNDGGVLGDLSFSGKGRVKFWDVNSRLVINGASYKLEKTLAGIAADIGSNPAGYYALADNYDASVDGTYGETAIGTPLTGAFEGLGNAILNLSTDGDNAGLFYFLEAGATLRDLTVSGAIQSFYDEGLLVVVNKGLVAHCSSSGTVAGGSDGVGGLVGLNFGAVLMSHSSAALSGATNAPAGGLVGSNVGGSIVRSFATGNINENDAIMGGLIGTNSGLVRLSYATGSLTGMFGSAGGFVGENDKGTIEQSYASGAVTGGDQSALGGFAGINRARIRQSYSTGAVSASGDRNLIGGFVGADDRPGKIVDSFWDMDTSGVADGASGAGNIQNDAGIIGLTTQEFQSRLPAGFDRKIWTENAAVNNGFPYLKFLPPQ